MGTPVKDRLETMLVFCERCEEIMLPRGGYLMGGPKDWVAYVCTTCKDRKIMWRDKCTEV